MSKLHLNVFEDYVSQFDIMCMSETKLDTPVDIVDGYTFFNKDKNKFKYGGIHGINVLVKNHIAKYCQKINGGSECVMWLLVGLPDSNHNIIVGAVYVPCEGSVHHDKSMFDDICKDITDISSRYDAPILMMGDFNSRTAEMNDSIKLDSVMANACGLSLEDLDGDIRQNINYIDRYNMDKILNNNGTHLIDICKCFSM